MLSIPPATTISLAPAAMAMPAKATAFSPEPHTLLTVKEGTAIGIPACTAHWRAGFSPRPACSAFPMITSSTDSGPSPARFSASRTTIAPRSVAENSFRLPPNVPMAVLTAPTMTTSLMVFPLRRQPDRASQIDDSHTPASVIRRDPFKGGRLNDLDQGLQEVRLGNDSHQPSLPLHRQSTDAMGHHQFRRLLNLSAWCDRDEVSRHDLAHL